MFGNEPPETLVGQPWHRTGFQKPAVAKGADCLLIFRIGIVTLGAAKEQCFLFHGAPVPELAVEPAGPTDHKVNTGLSVFFMGIHSL